MRLQNKGSPGIVPTRSHSCPLWLESISPQAKTFHILNILFSYPYFTDCPKPGHFVPVENRCKL